MTKTAWLLPPALLVLGVMASYHWPIAADSSPSNSTLTKAAAAPLSPAPAKRPQIPTPRPTRPDLAEWWDFLQLLEHADAADFPVLWADLPKPDRPVNDRSLSQKHLLLLERWAELEPAAALAFVLAGEEEKPPLLRCLFGAWARHQPEEASAAIARLDAPAIQGAAVAGMLSAFKDDSKKLIAWSKRLLPPDTSGLREADLTPYLPDDRLLALLQADRTGVMEIAARLPDWFRNKLELLELAQLARTDPDEVLDHLRSREFDFTRSDAGKLLNGLVSLAEARPDKMILLMEVLEKKTPGLKLPDSATRAAVSLLRHLLLTNPAKAAEFAKKHLTDNTLRKSGAMVLESLTASHPAAALALAPLIPRSHDLLEVGLPRVTEANRPGTLAALSEAPASPFRNRLLLSSLHGWTSSSPGEARAWADALPAGLLKDQALAAIQDPKRHLTVSALAMGEIGTGSSVSEREAKIQLLLLLDKAFSSDPTGTTHLIANLPEGENRQRLIKSAASSMAGRSPAAALNWAGQLPDPDLQADAIDGIFWQWTRNEPRTASEWLPTMAPGPLRERAVESFAEGILQLDPEASLLWSATLIDPGNRQTRLEKAFQAWVKTGPDDIPGALENVPGLTGADRDYLLSLSGKK